MSSTSWPFGKATQPEYRISLVVSRAMSFGHVNPVWRPSCEEVFAAFAPVGAHTRLGLALDTCAPLKEVFQLPLTAAVGLLAVAIAAQAVTDETDINPHGDEIGPRALSTPFRQSRSGCGT
jgi:hypothetical protein